MCVLRTVIVSGSAGKVGGRRAAAASIPTKFIAGSRYGRGMDGARHATASDRRSSLALPVRRPPRRARSRVGACLQWAGQDFEMKIAEPPSARPGGKPF